LARREKLSPPGMVWIAETCAVVGKIDAAEMLATAILEKRDDDEEFAERTKKAVPKLRTLLISINRQKGKYEEALAQVNVLISEHHTALEPLMEKGQILQTMADKDPDDLPKAIAHWEWLRQNLEGMKGKKPKEFYDVTYNEALCLYQLASKKGDVEQAKDGLKLLKQLMLLDPKFRDPKRKDPELAARYGGLVHKLEELIHKLQTPGGA